MVSLSRTTNTNAGGATFFSDSTNMEDTTDMLEPILESYGLFKPLRTVPSFSVHTLIAFALEVAAVAIAIKHPDPQTKCHEYFILIYLHVAFWIVTLLIDQLVRMRHYALRMNGYLDFYKKTQVHHRLPLYVVSLWNAAILILQTLMQHYYADDFVNKCLTPGLMSPINYYAALFTFEFCLIFGININYILKVREFNKAKPPPDVQRDEWNACSREQSFAQGEVGVRQTGDKLYDLLEKQADMIRHLKDHNERLGEKLMVLNAQLKARNANTSN